jgi:hypothetical protein
VPGLSTQVGAAWSVAGRPYLSQYTAQICESLIVDGNLSRMNQISIKPQTPDPNCRHSRLRGPLFLGESGALCDDCGKNLPCPHPRSARKALPFIGGPDVIVCGWCGEEG